MGSSRLRAQRLAARRPQRGLAAGRQQGATASRGNDSSRRGGRPLARWLPAGKCSCRLCRGSDGDVEGERGVRASFGEKDNPAPMNSKNFKDCPHRSDGFDPRVPYEDYGVVA
ncbi:hypothetical protein BHM03_00019515 [Ensete ventricosum]|nr:hypothetical protein BHM03_00019515 [Ensete ventricosum]